ncbi:MAG: ATP-dependent zinc metalloprotease FtsH [Parcubacteria group bacterium GW2011_GWC1_44_10]|nr:MAG: ATP-dependent zinc metalloprotease FtsH [Parcubacteria group bacterium GW2011_GWC1_44_10]
MQDYNEFLRMLNQGKFTEVEILKNDDGTITVTAKEKLAEKPTGKEVTKENAENQTVAAGKKYIITTLDDPQLIPELKSKPEVKYRTRRESRWFATLLGWIVPVALFFLLWSYLMKRMGGGVGGGVISFGKSRAKLLQETGRRVTFEDVAGVEEAKEDLREVIEFLRDPRKFTRLGGRLPKGCLLIGPPGTGKTLLARAVAGEANVPFFSITGSGFVEMFVGVGASRVRDMFDEAKKCAPSIIFVDELDAVGGKRGVSILAHDEREQTLNQLLAEMDGFESATGIIIMAATNRPEVLDPALLRPGRFDRQIVVPRPDVRGREAILKVHTRKVPLAEDADLIQIAKGTAGFSGADLENLVNEAALFAAKNQEDSVSKKDFELARDKVLMGSERKSFAMSPEEKRTTAYHEAGHTLVAKYIPGADPVHKVTIIPRGMALGFTESRPEEDRYSYTKSYLKIQLTMLMGGRVAEEVVFGEISTGASNDIQKATEMAHRMATEWGMSGKLGPLKYGGGSRNPFLVTQLMEFEKGYSEHTAQEIDQEVRVFVDEAYHKAREILIQKRDALDRLAAKLLEKETLEEKEIDEIIYQKPD